MCQNKTDSQKPFFGACAKVHAHATSMTTACRPASVVRGAFYILREEAPHGQPQNKVRAERGRADRKIMSLFLSDSFFVAPRRSARAILINLRDRGSNIREALEWIA